MGCFNLFIFIVKNEKKKRNVTWDVLIYSFLLLKMNYVHIIKVENLYALRIACRSSSVLYSFDLCYACTILYFYLFSVRC